jgi:hypothetical protein
MKQRVKVTQRSKAKDALGHADTWLCLQDRSQRLAAKSHSSEEEYNFRKQAPRKKSNELCAQGYVYIVT